MRSISRGLEQGQARGGISACSKMRYQGIFLASEQGQDTPKFTGRERVVGSRWFVCQGLEQRQEPACFSAGINVGSGVFVRVLPKGRSQPGSVRGPRCRFRSVCRVIEQGQDPPYLSAWTEMCPQECFSRFEHGKDADCFRSETEMWTQGGCVRVSNKSRI